MGVEEGDVKEEQLCLRKSRGSGWHIAKLCMHGWQPEIHVEGGGKSAEREFRCVGSGMIGQYLCSELLCQMVGPCRTELQVWGEAHWGVICPKMGLVCREG